LNQGLSETNPSERELNFQVWRPNHSATRPHGHAAFYSFARGVLDMIKGVDFRRKTTTEFNIIIQFECYPLIAELLSS